jgi:hypothetical protein
MHISLYAMQSEQESKMLRRNQLSPLAIRKLLDDLAKNKEIELVYNQDLFFLATKIADRCKNIPLQQSCEISLREHIKNEYTKLQEQSLLRPPHEYKENS